MEALNVSTQIWGAVRLSDANPSKFPSANVIETQSSAGDTINQPDGPICCWNFCPRDIGKKFPRHQSRSHS